MKFSILTHLEPEAWVAEGSKLRRDLPEIEKKLQKFDADLKCSIDPDSNTLHLKGKKIKGSVQFQNLDADEANKAAADGGAGPYERPYPYRSRCMVELRLPLMWSAFKGQIQKQVQNILKS